MSITSITETQQPDQAASIAAQLAAECALLEKVQFVFLELACEGDLKAADLFLKIFDRRIKLLGLDGSAAAGKHPEAAVIVEWMIPDSTGSTYRVIPATAEPAVEAVSEL